ncbi:MAG TPA: hypothetical protein PKW95_21140 [bacterium]|nr:hypothetical protein [bacterium]
MGKIDIGQAFGKGWELFSKNMLPLIIGMLLTAIIGGFSLGILMPAMIGGMFMIVRKSWNGETAEIGDVFGGFKKFGTLFVGGLLAMIISSLGAIACGIGAIVTSAMVIFVFPLIVDKDMGIGESIGASFGAFKENWLGTIVISLLAGRRQFGLHRRPVHRAVRHVRAVCRLQAGVRRLIA